LIPLAGNFTSSCASSRDEPANHPQISPTRLVFLPPEYAIQKNKRYPVVYALHAHSIGVEQ
jgi:hypothetical protein